MSLPVPQRVQVFPVYDDGATSFVVSPRTPPLVTAGLSYVLFLFLLYLLQLGTAGVVMAMVAAIVLAVLNRARLTRLFGARAFVFLVPVLCLASVVWSEDRGVSLRYGLEMLATVAVGLILSLADRRSEVLLGIFAAFATYTISALALGHSVGEGTLSAAFSGFNSGKNFMAEIASTGALVSLAIVAVAIGRRSRLWLAAGLVAATVLGVEIYVLALARSAGAIIAFGLGAVAFVGLYAVSRMPQILRGVTVAVAGLVLAVIGVLHDQFAAQVSQTALSAFHKDPTLTGRTYLWYRAHQMIAEKPLLGRGFYAFWREGNSDAEGLWRFGGIDNHYGFNFHNTGVETLIQFGAVGVVVLALVMAAGLLFQVRRFVLRPDAIACFWLALSAFELTRAFYETIGPAPFYFSNILIAAAFGSAFVARPRWDIAEPTQRRGRSR